MILGRILIVCAALAVSGACAETLYVVTLRDYSNKETEGLGGALFEVDSATGKAALIAPLRIGGVLPIGVT